MGGVPVGHAGAPGPGKRVHPPPSQSPDVKPPSMKTRGAS
jgi:hypothetical protein